MTVSVHLFGHANSLHRVINEDSVTPNLQQLSHYFVRPIWHRQSQYIYFHIRITNNHRWIFNDCISPRDSSLLFQTLTTP